MSTEREALETVIGHPFRDQGLLRQALTHKSYAYEKSTPGEPPLADNEQLEFLGDSVLGFLVSELLLRRYPTLTEGRLSRLTAHLVSATHLHQVAKGLGLGSHLLLGHGEELSGGRAKKALLSDALEALIAAIYLDAGLGPARQFVLTRVAGDLDTLYHGAEPPLTNFKSALQEAAHARGLPLPRYIVVGQTGPEHEKTFIVEARAGREWAAEGEGPTKKAAGQKAAQSLLEKLASSTSGS
jgi:ribonuclease-3